MQSLLQDLKYGFRTLAKTPAIAIVIVLTLSLGIGASTLLFNMVRQWVIGAVKFPHSEQLVSAWEIDTKKGYEVSASAPDFLDWREQNQVFENLSAWTVRDFNLTGNDRPERVSGARVSANFFNTLQARPALGRTFLAEEESPGRDRVVILSHGLWHDRFNAEPALIGRTITVDGESRTVIGVMPEDFHFSVMGRANMWVPLAFTDKERADRLNGWLQVVGRMRPSVTIAQAQTAMDPIAQRLEKLYPDSNTNSGIFLRSLRHEVGRNVGDQGVYMGFCLGICVLLVACANVAGILLARALARQREMAVRISLGAGRLRLVRQLLSENVWLFIAGAVLGIAFAKWGGDWVTSAIPNENRGYLPNYGRVYLDFATLAYAVGIALLTSLLFGLAPAMQSSNPNLTTTLKDAGGAASLSLRGRRMRKVLIVLEVSMALATLVPAGVMTRWLKTAYSVDLGFRPDHILTARVNLPATKYADMHRVSNFYDGLLEGIQGQPGVANASASDFIPFGNSSGGAEIFFEGRPAPEPGSVPFTALTSATPGYLATMGLQLVKGRFISRQDTAESQPVIVINQTFVQRHFAGNDPLGQRIQLGHEDKTLRTVVGIVKDITRVGIGSGPARAESYIPFAQAPARAMTLELRTAQDPQLVAATLRESVWRLDPDQPISEIVPMAQLIDNRVAPFRILTQFTDFFGLIALFLAAMGIYGTMAYIVAGRTREIGIRMALGALPRHVLQLIISQGARLTFVGIALGLAGGFALTQMLAGLFFGMKVLDPLVYAGAASVIGGAILLASYLPARLAAKVDPLVALRHD
jgi:putative ABC transport system permease protein